MSWVELAPPTELAVDLDQLKQHLRVTHNDEDAAIELYARAATDLFERQTRRRLISRSFRLDLPAFPKCGDPVGIELPFAPVESVTHVKYYDTAGVLQTWDSGAYIVDLTSRLPRVSPGPNEPYPDTQCDRPNAVQVTFVAGYGDDFEAVPHAIRVGIFYIAAHMFSNRAPVNVGNITSELPKTLQYVVDSYRIWGV